MLKNQWSIDSNILNYKKNLIIISGMSNKAASNLSNKDLFLPSIYNLILDFKQYPSISSIEDKNAAFNLILGRQCKFKLTIPLFKSPLLFPLFIISLNSNIKLNNNHFNFGLIKTFYGAHIQFNFYSPFSASYFLLPFSK